MRVVVWVSYGEGSAVTWKLAVEKYGKDVVVPVNCDTSKNEHPDNLRYRRDIEEWVGQKIITIASEKYSTVEEVIETRRWMSGPYGAPCTTELKKIPRFAFQLPDDVHLFGFAANEKRRIRDFEHDNHDLSLEWILRDQGITKKGCASIMKKTGIKRPALYDLGYRNNNCLGCVKASSPGYWNKTRIYFPDVFALRAEESRRLGAKLVEIYVLPEGATVKVKQRIFLDELDPNWPDSYTENVSCGPECGPKPPVAAGSTGDA